MLLEPSLWVRFQAFSKIASVRFATYYVVGFLAGLLADGASVFWLDVVLGLIFWSIFSIATEVLNRWADRAEDAVNRPVRTRLCDVVGMSKLRAIGFLLWGVALAIVIGWSASFEGQQRWTVLGVYCLSVVAGMNYSVGLRLKTRRYGALVVLAFPIAATLYCGSIIRAARNDPSFSLFGFDGAAEMYSLGLSLTLLLGTLASLKDITDLVGDRAIGFDSTVRLVTGSARLAVAILAGAASGFFVFFGLGWLPSRYFLLLLFLVSGFWISRLASRAVDDDALMYIRELHYLHWLLVLGVAGSLYARSFRVVVIWMVAAVLWPVLTRYAHWTTALIDGAGRQVVLRRSVR